MGTLIERINRYYQSLPEGGIRVVAIRLQPRAAKLIALETCPADTTPELHYEHFVQDLNREGKGKMGGRTFEGGAVGCDVEIQVIPREQNLSKAYRIEVNDAGILQTIIELDE